MFWWLRLSMKILVSVPKLLKKRNRLVIDLYNNQTCEADVVNEMLKDDNSPLISNGWTVIVFTLFLDLVVTYAQTILKYNFFGIKPSQNRNSSDICVFNLCLPYIKKRRQIPSLQENTKATIDSVFNYMQIDEES